MHARLYSRADERETLDLFRASFGKQITREYWRWLEENPAGGIIRTVMEDAGSIAGYYSVMPLRLKAADCEMLSALSVGTMTHPDYRGKGVFTNLARETYAITRQKGIEFICGFPNDNSYPGFIKNLGWFDICQMPLLELEMAGSKGIAQARKGLCVSHVREYQKEIGSIHAAPSTSFSIMNYRSCEHLNWRYRELCMWEGQPERKYEKYVVRDADGGIVGYMALKLYNGKDEKKAHIVDILTLPGRSDAFECLAAEAYEYALENNADSISCWMLEHTDYYSQLLGMGYKDSQEKRQIFAGCLNSQRSKKEFIADKDKWFITMGDSDVF